ncbi:MAG: hypothetical protein ACK4S4_15890 [Pyrinomonadaceae bacterium]
MKIERPEGPFDGSMHFGNSIRLIDSREMDETKIGGKTFKNIGHEIYRRYFYRDANGEQYHVEVKFPQWLRVTATGSHRVVDKDGAAYYIPPGFTHIKWKSKEGTEPVRF